MSEKLDSAIRIAVKCHAGQVDKAGQPYILHPLRVMNAVRHEGETAMIAAVLHDVVEDSKSNFYAINSVFGDGVLRLVHCLTRSKDKETYAEYIQRVKLNPMATKIKIADLYDNLSRIDQLPESERGIRKRYEAALTELGAPLWGDDAALAEVHREDCDLMACGHMRKYAIYALPGAQGCVMCDLKELRAWKESAIDVMSPLQEIGRALEVGLGESISDEILPRIESLKKDRYFLRKAIKVMIGRRTNTPWAQVPNPEVDAWIAELNA